MTDMMPEIVETSAVESITRAEFDVQIMTAKRFPMHSDAPGIERFRNDAIAMATIDEETAQACLYALPRGGKTIQGRSVRLAEIVMASYGNIRSGARIIETTQTHVVAQGVCHDLERNVYQSVEVRRRITDRNGKRFNDDMITVTANAACSIATRNAIYKVIPAALCEPVYQAARQMAVGDKTSIEIRRPKALEKFALMGVTNERVLARLGVASVSDIGPDELGTMIGLYNAIKNGEEKIDTVFPFDDPVVAPRANQANLKHQIETAGLTLNEARQYFEETHDGRLIETATRDEGDALVKWAQDEGDKRVQEALENDGN